MITGILVMLVLRGGPDGGVVAPRSQGLCEAVRIATEFASACGLQQGARQPEKACDGVSELDYGTLADEPLAAYQQEDGATVVVFRKSELYLKKFGEQVRARSRKLGKVVIVKADHEARLHHVEFKLRTVTDQEKRAVACPQNK